MFSEESLISSGKHLICDIKDIKNISLLNNLNNIQELFNFICKKYDFQVLRKIEYKFEPEGFSIIYLLSESHMSIHTFPEKKYAAIDLYTCRNYDDNTIYNEIYNHIITQFNAKKENPVIIDRNF